MLFGALFSGSTTTILLNAPGESAPIGTALEGSRIAKAGRAGPALATSALVPLLFQSQSDLVWGLIASL